MKYSLASAVALSLFASSVAYACPTSSPPTGDIALKEGDQRVGSQWLEETLAGNKLRFDEGTEHYHADGSYTYVENDGTEWHASEYKFYDSGMRCIAYDPLRFDLYVISNGELILVNNHGRFAGNLIE